MTQQRERLIRAMIDSPDLEGAFRFDAEFKAQVTVIADMLPIILKALHDEAYHRHERGRRAYRDITVDLTPAMYTNEEIEELRIQAQTPMKERTDGPVQ